MTELPQLPSDVLSNILSRLPVKPLGRFKCVSKAWCSLISSPQFAKMQLKFFKQDSSGYHQKVFLMTNPFLSIDYEAYSDGDDNLPITQLAFPIRQPLHDQIIGSCDGLICAVFDKEHHIIVWNPSTGQARELPRLNYSPESGMFYGFGYDCNLDDHKVVLGFRTNSPDSSIWGYKVEVFTLKSSRWRTIEFLQCSDLLTGAGTLANGVLHWQLEKNDHLQNVKHVIIPFDLAAEKFLDAIPLPDVIDHTLLSDELTVHGDCICAYTSFYGCCGSDYEAWILEGNGSNSEAKWTSLIKFNCYEISGRNYWIELLCIAKNGNVLMDLDGYEIILYNPRDQTFKRFPIEQEWGYFTRILYIESLVSP